MGPDREELRRRLTASCPSPDLEHLFSGPEVPAAVLIAVLDRPEGPHIVLTHRQADLKNHAAEISLPGGRVEAADRGPEAAALREAFEEIGLGPERVELLGCLPTYMTVSNFRVYPFVGWIEPPVEFTLDASEVAEVFEVPLSFMLDPANRRWERRESDGEQRSFYVLPYQGHHIWGATAEILVSLAHILARRKSL